MSQPLREFVSSGTMLDMAEFPTAIRATAGIRTTIFARRRRVFRYDAQYSDGRITRDLDGVGVDVALQGRHRPADAWATRDAAEATCPELGTGQWVEYATGRPIGDGPEL